MDARSKGRFEGTEPEPRAGLRSSFHALRSFTQDALNFLQQGRAHTRVKKRSIWAGAHRRTNRSIGCSLCAILLHPAIIFLAACLCPCSDPEARGRAARGVRSGRDRPLRPEQADHHHLRLRSACAVVFLSVAGVVRLFPCFWLRSGVTASVLALALHALGHKNIHLYDGSWSEWVRHSLLVIFLAFSSHYLTIC